MSTLTEVDVRCNGFGGGRQRSDDLNIVRWLFSGDARGGDILPWWGVVAPRRNAKNVVGQMC